MPAIYALLVGINGYPSKPLRGCINDVNAVEEYLHKMYDGKPGVQLHIRRVTDQDERPTRENIIKAFDHYAPAANDDTCLFYYSGHGSFSKAPREFWTETDGFVESFVCIDSRVEGGRDLVDKEMGYLIAKTMASKPGVSFIAITDCCHSGTITRAMSEGEVIERSYEPSYMPQSVDSYYGFKEKIDGEAAYVVDVLPDGQKRVTVRQGRHIHLAAAQDNQTAKELQIDGQQRGAFTFSLLKTLYGCQGLATYQDLVKLVKLQVQNIVKNQDPLVNPNGGMTSADLKKYFLSAVSSATTPLFTVHWKNSIGWCIDAGSIQGVSVGDEVMIKGLPALKVTEQTASDYSVLENSPSLGDDHAKVYEATVQVQPNQKIRLSFAEGINPTVQQLIEAAYQKAAPAYVELSPAGSSRFFIKSNKLETFVSLPTDNAPLFKSMLITDEVSAAIFLAEVNTVCKWFNLQELNNPNTTITGEHYKLTLYRTTTAGNYDDNGFEQVQPSDEPIDFYYRYGNNKWNQPALKLQITNTSSQDLWFNCLYMGFDYAIAASLMKQVRLPAGESAWLTLLDKGVEKPVIKLNVEKKFLDLGYRQIVEYLKLFISTKNIDLGHFEQEGIELADIRTRGEVVTKGAGAEEEEATIKADDWRTVTVGLRITKPEESAAIVPGKPVTLNDITIEPHGQLQAKFSISSSAETARSADGVVAPNKAYRNGGLEPFDLFTTMRSGASSDVLELFGAVNKEAVTAKQPLVISLPASRAVEDDGVIAVGYDEETKLYYPVGYSNAENKIVIHALPEETASDAAITQKSFLGSIKIYFQKMLGKVGLKYDYPRLAIAEVSDEGDVIYTKDEGQVKAAVAKASSILLCVHGIIGDTKAIVKSVKPDPHAGWAGPDGSTNLVLAFDYENLNTTIEDNAALLKKRLEAVGLGVGHDKHLTIMAHSMGGLVSRWFIEKLEGNTIVNELIMFGTPNHGTPWADVRDMAESLLTFGINGAATLQPWLFAISLVGKLAKGVQVTLKQMDSETGIYKQLNNGADPGIPYGIIAGNTREIVVNYDETASAISRLLTRVRKRGAYTALDVLLFKKPNDIAVAVDSIEMQAESDSWGASISTTTVSCDHLNYFSQPSFVSGLQGFALQYSEIVNDSVKEAAAPPPPPPPPPRVVEPMMPPPQIHEESARPAKGNGGGGKKNGGRNNTIPESLPDDTGSDRSIPVSPAAASQEGQLEYEIPEAMKVGKIHSCKVRIADKEVDAALLRISEHSVHTDTRISEEMSVTLIDISGGDYFEIVSINSERQAILADEVTSWDFRVKPVKAGKFPLMLKVTMHLGGRNKDLSVLEKEVLVSSDDNGAPGGGAQANGAQRILFLCANPKDTVRLRTEAEAREIKEEIRMGDQRDNILFTLDVAVTTRTLSRSLMQEKPTVVHFSGHGEGQDGICFETDGGLTQLVTATALGLLFKSLRIRPQCVVLNACYSEEQAKAIVQHIPFVIGMNNSVQDKAAIAFSIGFYQAIGAGYDIEGAFDMGLAGMAMASNGQEQIPVLLKKG